MKLFRIFMSIILALMGLGSLSLIFLNDDMGARVFAISLSFVFFAGAYKFPSLHKIKMNEGKKEENKELSPFLKNAKEEGKVFENLKYISGILGEKKKKFHIAAVKDGIFFIDVNTMEIEEKINWKLLKEITCPAMSGSEQAYWTGAYASSKSTKGLIGTAIAQGLVQKTPLVFKFKKSEDDDFIYEIICDNPENEKIKNAIISMRAKYLYSQKR